jgi:type I restriction enzyme S subunit
MTLFHQVRAAGNVWAPFEAVGTVFGAINKGQLESIALPEVDHSQAERLETDLVDLEHRIAAALAENERLAAARDELLPLLMSGKVQVGDARQVIEGVA